MTGGVIRSFDRWGTSALIRSYPLLFSELFLHGYTKGKIEALLNEFKFFETPEDRSLLSTSKVFFKSFISELIPSLVTLPVVTLAVVYAADIGANRRFASIKELL